MRDFYYNISWDQPSNLVYKFEAWVIYFNIDCWQLIFKGEDIFESYSLPLVFMVARELILEEISQTFVPSWQ